MSSKVEGKDRHQRLSSGIRRAHTCTLAHTHNHILKNYQLTQARSQTFKNTFGKNLSFSLGDFSGVGHIHQVSINQLFISI